MSEKLLEQALLEACEKEFAPFEDGEEHRFSRRHRRTMKAMFAEFSGKPKKKIPLKRRIIVAIIAILLAIPLGITANAYIERFFTRTQYSTRYEQGYQEIFWSDQNGDEKIERFYKIGDIPQGARFSRYSANERYGVDMFYMLDGSDNDGYDMFFSQFLKQNTAVMAPLDYTLITVKVGDYEGFYTEFPDHHRICWDHGDYMMSINAPKSFTVDELIEMAKSVVVDPDGEFGEWDERFPDGI